jgi:two-component system, cell cycle sensor histidine kinase and response regulator CckA
MAPVHLNPSVSSMAACPISMEAMPNPAVEPHGLQWLQAAVESSPSGVLITDAKGHIVLVNLAIERIFGYERTEVIGQRVEILMPEGLRRVHASNRGEFAAEPHARAMGAGREFVGRHRDGTTVPLEIGLTPMPTADGVFVIGSIVDISARKQAESERASLEEQLRQAQKMEAIGRLAGGIAHDFNNILTAIIGFSDLARDELPASSIARADLDQIQLAAARGTALTKQMLAFSRHQPTQQTLLDLNQVVVRIDAMLRRLLGADVKLVTRAGTGIGSIFADPHQIEQVLMNLAINARDAMPNGGTLTIETQSVRLDEVFARNHIGVTPGRHIVLAVTDTGIGMSAETKARIFEPFFTTKPAGKGTGLGLSTVYGIVKRFGGTVWVHSEPGHGTTFKVYLPEHVEGRQRERLTPNRGVPLIGEGRILLVDDDDAVRGAAGRVLERAGYTVRQASNGREALAIIEDAGAELDLVIADVTLPELGGAELASIVGERWPTLCVLLTSGYTGTLHDDAPHMLTGAYIEKPFAPADLLSKVHGLLITARA